MLRRSLPQFSDLRAFLSFLEERNDLVAIDQPVSMHLDVTELQQRVLDADGPALMLNNPLLNNGQPSRIPVVVNLFGAIRRVAWGLGVEPEQLQDLGELLAFLRQPQPPSGLGDALKKWPVLKTALATRPGTKRKSPVNDVVHVGDAIDLTSLPIQSCWPGEPAPLITWPLVITRPPDVTDINAYNWGIYRMQVVDKQSTLMRWLAHRGGAAHHRQWLEKGEEMPVAVAIGADPATILGGVTPVPETLSEAQFSGIYRGASTALVEAQTVPLLVPASAEIILEGHVSLTDTLPEGPYGDHTGYYNSVEPFPIFKVSAITHRQDPVYLSTFTGRAPDEPSVLSAALNDVFLPLARQAFPEIVDCWLPPEASSYRIAVISINKTYPGQARRVMMGLWSMLPQFTYTKLIIAVDGHIDARDWSQVMWAVATKSDPSRDLLQIDRTPVDYLDFASPRESLGGKLGIDATDKIGSETDREWGKELAMDVATKGRVDALLADLGDEIAGKMFK